MNYQGADEDLLLTPLEEKIKELHQKVGNAKTEGYEVVPAYGALMVLDALLYAITESGKEDYYEVFVQPPFYARYPIVVENGIASRRTAEGRVIQRNWNVSADPNASNVIEILTLPSLFPCLFFPFFTFLEALTLVIFSFLFLFFFLFLFLFFLSNQTIPMGKLDLPLSKIRNV